MSVSIIIPSYNEYPNLTILIDEINKNLKNKLKYEIIIVDDCSLDNTVELFFQEKFINCSLIQNKKNHGQSYSILKGIKKAKFQTIITLDADLQNNPIDILKLYKIYNANEKLKLVGGIRLNRKDKLIKILSSRVANFIRSLVLNDNCSDTGCALKVFDRDIFLTFPFFNGIHRFLPAFFKGYDYQTLFVNVDHRARMHGVSKYGTVNRLFRGIIDIIKVKKIIKNHKKLKNVKFL
jgi:dolichol-phosphate mannosyltransferase